MIIVDAVTGKVKRTDIEDSNPIERLKYLFQQIHIFSKRTDEMKMEACQLLLPFYREHLYAGDWQSWFKQTFDTSTSTVERWFNKFVTEEVKQIRAAKPKCESAERVAAFRQRQAVTSPQLRQSNDEVKEDDSEHDEYEMNDSDCDENSNITIDTKSTDSKLINPYIINTNWSEEERNIYKYHFYRPIVINVMKHPNLRKWAEKEGRFLYAGYGDSKKHGLVGNKKWGNPEYKFDHKNDKARAKAIESYKKHFYSHPELLDSIEELKDKVLGCWCHPKPCHCDFLVEQFIAKRDGKIEAEYQQALASKELNNYNSYKLYLYTPSNASGDDEEADSIYVSPELLEYFKKFSVKYNDDRDGLLYSILEFAENFERVNQENQKLFDSRLTGVRSLPPSLNEGFLDIAVNYNNKCLKEMLGNNIDYETLGDKFIKLGKKIKELS
ncbi:hypothetical protein B7486_45300 [cyanobacterium TDX16]|nr:hypothetical protein B7486_45300 [cyanobacterium TDX16]